MGFILFLMEFSLQLLSLVEMLNIRAIQIVKPPMNVDWRRKTSLLHYTSQTSRDSIIDRWVKIIQVCNFYLSLTGKNPLLFTRCYILVFMVELSW